MKLNNSAIILATLLLAYHQVTTWFPLFPWNDVSKYSRKELLLEAGFNGLFMGFGLVCLLARNVALYHWYPLLYYPFLLFGEFMDWWLPYFSPRFASARKAWDYEAKFSRTIKIIPRTLNKRTPDANHIVLHVLTVLTTTLVYWNRLT